MSYGLRLALVTVISIGVLWRTLPGALLFLFPWAVRQRAEPADENPASADPEPVRLTAPALEALGFERLGIRREKSALGPDTLSFDFVHRAEKTYASVYLVEKKTRRLYFFTPYDGGASVLTADHKRPSSALDGYYLAGWLKNATPDQLWAAHKRQLKAMDDTGRERVAKGTLANRMDCAQAWFHGAGKKEIRLRQLTPAAMTALALVMLGAVVVGLPYGHWERLREVPRPQQQP